MTPPDENPMSEYDRAYSKWEDKAKMYPPFLNRKILASFFWNAAVEACYREAAEACDIDKPKGVGECPATIDHIARQIKKLKEAK